MRRRRERKAIQSEGVGLNMTPMIDIVFLLIIFFMVATTFTRAEIDPSVKLAQAEEARDDLRKPSTLIINVRRDGTVRLGNDVYQPAEVPRVLLDIAHEDRDRVVVVRTDGMTTHRHFIKTLEACARVGLLNVRIAAKRVKTRKPSP